MVSTVEWGRLTGSILWTWQGLDSDYQEAWYEVSANTVYAIFPSFRVDFTLEDVFAAYGAPSFVQAVVRQDPHDDGRSYTLTFIYVPEGFAVSHFALLEPAMVPVDIRFDSATFFEPSLDGFSRAVRIPVETLRQAIVPWQGPRDFYFYCATCRQ